MLPTLISGHVECILSKNEFHQTHRISLALDRRSKCVAIQTSSPKAKSFVVHFDKNLYSPLGLSDNTLTCPSFLRSCNFETLAITGYNYRVSHDYCLFWHNPLFLDICWCSRLSFYVVNGHCGGFDFLKKNLNFSILSGSEPCTSSGWFSGSALFSASSSSCYPWVFTFRPKNHFTW